MTEQAKEPLPWQSKEAIELLQSAFFGGAAIWCFVAFKIYYFDKLPDSIFDHSLKGNINNFTRYLSESHLTYLSVAGFVAGGALFGLMMLFVVSFHLASLVPWYDKLVPNESLSPRVLFVTKWFLLLPVTLVVMLAMFCGLYQLAQLELWLIYR
ncbi:MAG: hypothetical protein EOR00_22200 [Mesorhizobium sp.]|uniref:hypothetical protein n=1 Tax=Mesorhizobium sp. TaxID=1871066 RepID=UPI000FE9B84A|nr:hypothetical protein [Mesorhizobium sp.]RWP14923.1 MAG: hypothetical protein EOR00_22200 [Mesorhizobium sp.]